MQTVDVELAECLELRQQKRAIEQRLSVLTEMLAVYYVVRMKLGVRETGRKLQISHVEVLRLIEPYRK